MYVRTYIFMIYTYNYSYIQLYTQIYRHTEVTIVVIAYYTEHQPCFHKILQAVMLPVNESVATKFVVTMDTAYSHNILHMFFLCCTEIVLAYLPTANGGLDLCHNNYE